jgi:hypothetical protein
MNNIFKIIIYMKSVFSCSPSEIFTDVTPLMKRKVFIDNILYLHGDINTIVSVIFIIDVVIKK